MTSNITSGMCFRLEVLVWYRFSPSLFNVGNGWSDECYLRLLLILCSRHAKASVSCFFHNMIYLFFRYRSNKFRSYYSLKRLGNRLYKKILKFYHIVNFWKQDFQYNNSCHVVNFISTDMKWIWQFHNQKYYVRMENTQYKWRLCTTVQRLTAICAERYFMTIFFD